MSKLSREEKRRKKEEAKQAKAERKARQDAVKSDGSLLISMLIVLLVLVGIWNFAMVGVIGFSYTRAARERAAALSQSVPPTTGQSVFSGSRGNSGGSAAGGSMPENTPETTPDESDAPDPTEEPPQDAVPESTSPATQQPEASQNQPDPVRPAENNGSGSTGDNGGNDSLPVVPPKSETSPSVADQLAVQPVQQTQSPEQPGNQEGGNGDGFDTERFDRPNWGEKGNFLGSTDSNKYHRTNCTNGAARIRPENERWFDTEEEAQAAGYERCGICWR